MEFSTEILISLVTLTFLEIVLGIDNIVFISIVGSRLPVSQQKKVRILGLALALVGRILLLLAIEWIIGLTKPIFTINDFAFSFRDLILIVGGLFLIAKSTSEMHKKLETSKEEETKKLRKYTMRSAIVQILLLDLVFSLDSIITAVGLVDQVYIIVIAIVISMGVMLIFSKAISDFINNHPTMKLLAIAFLLMIGTLLVIEGLHVHVPKGYIYFSMAFALAIEVLNMRIRKNQKPKA
ncbi:MAG: TerC family protein [Cyclobacteriaceae bacterium]|nr:TerC family protein [Cyclobacteriaceae bacterium]